MNNVDFHKLLQSEEMSYVQIWRQKIDCNEKYDNLRCLQSFFLSSFFSVLHIVQLFIIITTFFLLLYVIGRMWNSIMREMRYKMQVLCMVGA